METLLSLEIPVPELLVCNHCGLCLKVTLLSDITIGDDKSWPHLPQTLTVMLEDMAEVGQVCFSGPRKTPEKPFRSLA